MERDGNGMTSIETLRARARDHLDGGAVTESYAADRDAVLRMLNAALATEIVCNLRYRRHFYMAMGMQSESVKAEFREHADQETQHADQIAERIVQLGGEPDFNPAGIAGRSHAEYVEGRDLDEMIKEDLVAERIAIDSYREMIQYLGDRDPTTRRMMEEILAVEEEHAEDLSSILGRRP